MTIEIVDDDFAQASPAPLDSSELIGHHQFDPSGSHQLAQAPHTLWSGAELVPSVDDGDMRRHISQRQGPVNRRVATAGNDDTPVAKIFPALDEIADALARRLVLEGF